MSTNTCTTCTHYSSVTSSVLVVVLNPTPVVSLCADTIEPYVFFQEVRFDMMFGSTTRSVLGYTFFIALRHLWR